MVAEETRNAVWQEFLDVARLVRYYSNLSDRHSRKQWIVRVLLLAVATSGIAALVDLLPPLTQDFAATAVAFLVVWDILASYEKKAVALHAICIECIRLENDLRQLWEDIDRPDLNDAEARRQCALLSQKLNEATARVNLVGVQEDAKLNQKCAKDSYEVMRARYAT